MLRLGCEPRLSLLQDILLVLDPQTAVPSPTTDSLSRSPEWGAPCEGAHVFAAQRSQSQRISKAFCSWLQRAGLLSSCLGQRSVTGMGYCQYNSVLSSSSTSELPKETGAAESLNEQRDPSFTENPKTGPTTECLTLQSPSPSEPPLCHL